MSSKVRTRKPGLGLSALCSLYNSNCEVPVPRAHPGSPAVPSGVNAEGISVRLGAFKTLSQRFKRCRSPLYKQIKVVSVFRVRLKCGTGDLNVTRSSAVPPCRGSGHTASSRGN